MATIGPMSILIICTFLLAVLHARTELWVPERRTDAGIVIMGSGLLAGVTTLVGLLGADGIATWEGVLTSLLMGCAAGAGITVLLHAICWSVDHVTGPLFEALDRAPVLRELPEEFRWIRVPLSSLFTPVGRLKRTKTEQ